MVNEWLGAGSYNHGWSVFTDGTLIVANGLCCSYLAHPVARNPRSNLIPILVSGILLTVRGAASSCLRGVRKGCLR